MVTLADGQQKKGLHENSYPSSDEDQSLLVRRRSFERSQRAQRCLLCFGEPPDARDIEALVGAIPPQGAQMLATRQARPIRTPRHAHHHTTMPLQAGLLGSGGGLPQDDAAIVAATGQLLPVRAPRHPADRGWLPMTYP